MDHGTFLGWIGDDVLHSLYRIADVCVVPSIYEPFGLVALEAMASGCPCIVADTGGLREVVPHNEAGLRFRARDSRGARGDGRARARRRRARATGSWPRAPSTCCASTGPTSPSARPRSTRAGASRPRRRVQGTALGLDRVGPAQRCRRLAHPQHPRRDAADDRVRGHVLRDHRVRPDDRVVADADAAQHAGAVADPHVRADVHVAHVDPLAADRALDLDHAVVEVDEHRPVGDHALLADPHVPVGRDRALLADHRLLADHHLALVAADLGPVADPDEAPEADLAALGDLQLAARGRRKPARPSPSASRRE